MKPLNPSSFLADTLRPYATGAKQGLPGKFERYLLEPDDVDDAAIKQRLDDVRAIWARSFEHPRYGNLAKLLAGEHDDAELELLDPTERNRLSTKAREERDAADRNAAAALEGWRAVLAERVQSGGLTPNSRTMLERLAVSGGLDPDVVQRELDAAPVAETPAPLSPDVRSQIRTTLQDLAREVGEESLSLSLYHALGLGGITEDQSEVRQMFDRLKERAAQQAHGRLATSYATVLANVKLYVLDSDPRAYIEGLVEDVREAMAFEGAQVAADGFIDATEAEALLRSAIARGLTPELGRRVIAEIARENDASIEAAAPVDYVSCPACNTPHPRPTAPSVCKRCATALFVDCPVPGCGERNDATALRCTACQTDLHRFAEATRRLRTLPDAARQGRVAWAAAEMEEIVSVLGRDAIPADVQDEITRRMAEAQERWAAVEAAISGRRLYAARTTLRELSARAADVLGPTGEHPAARLEEVERRLADVDAALARARSSSGADREAAFVEAATLAEDCEEAANALAAIPPAPPGRVTVRMEPGGPVVDWGASASPSTSYVLRRVDSRTGDVEPVGTTDATRFQDRAVPAGALVRYEVAAARGRATSAFVASDTLVVTAEIQGLQVADHDGEVRLSWQPAPATARVVVRRRAEHGGEVQELMADRAGLVDRDVANGQRYAYHVLVEYTGRGGEVTRTSGLTVYGQPAAPPEGIDSLRITTIAGGAVVAFDRPASGSVTILRCTERPDAAFGDALEPGELARLGDALPVGPDGARDTDGAGVRWYLPVTVSGGSAVAGRAIRHLALPDIANVRVVEAASQLKVTWEWPPDVRLAQVLWRRDRQPLGSDDPGVQAALVRLGEYRDHGGFTIEAPGPEPVFVAVVPALRVDGEVVTAGAISKGARATAQRAQKVDLRYSVAQRSGLRKKRLQVEVTPPPGEVAPNLVLVARPGDLLPRTANDGDVIARLGGAEPMAATVDLSGRSRPLAVRLFLESSSSSTTYQLFDPSADDLLIR